MNASPSRSLLVLMNQPRCAALRLAVLLTASASSAVASGVATGDAAASDAAASYATAETAATPATATEAAVAEAPTELAPSDPDAFDPLGQPLVDRQSRVGLMFDLGTVDGGMLSLVFRHSPWLRVYGGGGTNGASPGLRAGVSLAPLRQRGFALNLDGGHFFPGDVNGIFSAFAGANYNDSRLLEDFDYHFVNLQAGWEVERGGLMFFVRGGVAFVWSQVEPEGLSQVRNLSSLVDSDGSVEAFLPSLRVGMIGFL
ncbi:MAG: hypothetical protein RL685_2420 [Pseudomonadota bacterium]|jgi:hypothetical protein